MKLVKFARSDAPRTTANATLSATALTVGDKRMGAGQTWTITEPTHKYNDSTYLLYDEKTNQFIPLSGVLIATPAHSSSNVATPKGVSDDDVLGVNLRGGLGRTIERARAEYGATYKTAANQARNTMTAEADQERYFQKRQKELEAVAEAVEAGENIVPAAKKPRKK